MSYSSENHRLGIKKCSPFANALFAASFIVKLLAIVPFFIFLLLAIKDYFVASVTERHLQVFLFLLGMFAASFIIGWAGRCILKMKKFRYDYAADTCQWINKGQHIVYPDRQ